MTIEPVTIDFYVAYCDYWDCSDTDFPHGFVSFSNLEDHHTRFYIITNTKPPIQEGQYAQGTAFHKTLHKGLKTILVVDSLRLFDKQNGKQVAQYLKR